MAQNEPLRQSGQNLDIPDKLYFRIGDVAKLCEVPAYVLRFWEAEFPQLKPNKGGTGQRLYRRRDVEIALRIKGLLYVEGYTIPGARLVLKGEQRGGTRGPQLALAIEPSRSAAIAPGTRHTATLNRLRRELADLHQLLSQPPGDPSLDQPRRVRSLRTARTPHQLLFAPALPSTPPSETAGNSQTQGSSPHGTGADRS